MSSLLPQPTLSITDLELMSPHGQISWEEQQHERSRQHLLSKPTGNGEMRIIWWTPDTDSKKTITDFLQEFQELKKIQVNEMVGRELEKKCLSGAQENTNRLVEMMQILRDLRKEFSKETETLKRTQAKIRPNWKTQQPQLENWSCHYENQCGKVWKG